MSCEPEPRDPMDMWEEDNSDAILGNTMTEDEPEDEPEEVKEEVEEEE